MGDTVDPMSMNHVLECFDCASRFNFERQKGCLECPFVKARGSAMSRSIRIGCIQTV